MSKKIEEINQFIQQKLKDLKIQNITAVEMAKYLDDSEILKDNKTRPGLPLRNYLRSNSILGGYQNSSKRWFIKQVNAVEDLVSVVTAARLLNVSEQAIYKKIERKEIIPKIHGKNRLLIPKSQIIDLINLKNELESIRERESSFSFSEHLKNHLSEIKTDLNKIIKKIDYLEDKIMLKENFEVSQKNYRIKIKVNGKEIDTLDDILPIEPGLEVLFIAKTPAPISVRTGHYFQGKQGKMFWNKLREYKIFNPPLYKYEDNYLLEYKFGITDIVKVPHNFDNEPTTNEYKSGLDRILNLIDVHNPKVIVFVYKKVLDKILNLSFNISEKAKYGFNTSLENLFRCKVFVFPMPGTPCTTEESDIAMSELKLLMN